MKEKHNPLLKALFLETVDAQLRNNDPPETRETFDRLRANGIGEKDAKVLIASAVAVETYQIMKSGTPFNHERFVRNLKQLPNQSFEE
jgi:hypothetical protein